MARNPEQTIVYTDGACSGNPGPGGWAWAVPDGAFASGAEKHTTNQRMEIHAVLDAVRSIDGAIEVVSDSTYVVNCFRDRWWEGWLKRNWQTSAKKPVANRDLWEPLIEIVRARDISFRWVKGHSGDAMNDLVDMLAVVAARTQEPRRGDRPPDTAGLVPDDVAMAARKERPAAGADAPAGHLLLIAGHKPPEIGGYGPNPTADAVRRKLTEIISAKAAITPDLRIMTGLGLGVEQIAAESAIEAAVPFVVILPYPDQQSVWPEQSKRSYEALLARAEGEVLLQASPPETKQKAGAALNRRNAWLAGHAAEAVVVWDGKEEFLGRLVRSLQDHLGEADVWVEPVPAGRQ